MKLKLNNRGETEKYTNMWKLNNVFCRRNQKENLKN